MPPAFNLSQDQTLQFDLEYYCSKEIEENFNFFLSVRDSLRSLRSCDPEAPHVTRTPTLIGCMFLKSCDFGSNCAAATCFAFRCVVQRRIEFWHKGKPLSSA